MKYTIDNIKLNYYYEYSSNKYPLKRIIKITEIDGDTICWSNFNNSNQLFIDTDAMLKWMNNSDRNVILSKKYNTPLFRLLYEI